MTSPDWKQASPARSGRESQLALAFPKWPAKGAGKAMQKDIAGR